MSERTAWGYLPERGINGFVPESELCLPPDVHGLHYGTSVIEGIRAYHGTREETNGKFFFRLPEHTERLFRSAKLYGMASQTLHAQMVMDACLRLMAMNEQDTYIRPCIFRGSGLGVDPTDVPVWAFVITRPWGRYLNYGHHNDGVKVETSTWRRADESTLPPGAKGAGNYIAGSLAKMRARANDVAEPLLLAPDGESIAEGSGMNLFVVQAGSFFTPPLSSGVLAGITRETVITLIRELTGQSVVEEPITNYDLHHADEVFFTGTATEITPVTMIDGDPVGHGASHLGHAGPITLALMERYQDLVHGKSSDHRGWISFVPLQSRLFAEPVI